ncbi:MAG: IS630 family transposase [Steroidobacteraceae bacterium]
MRRLARRPGIELWSLDECHFQQHGSRCRMWVAPELKDPVLQHAPTRKSVACFGAVNLGNGVFVRTVCSVFNAETFQHFLRQLLRHRAAPKRMILVLDNARYHHARLLRPFLRGYRRVLSLLFLPPYSPQLAPIERVWKLARRLATHNRYFPTLAEVLHAVNACFDAWRRPNRVLRRLCCII